MAITPAAGYIVDPNNKNAVMRDPNNMQATTALAQGQLTGGTGLGVTNTNPALQQPAPMAPPPAAPITTQGASAPTQPQGTPAAQTGAQPMTFNGSVVDLLNTAGEDSSLVNRMKLAQTYGMQGYTGANAAQQKEFADKFIAAHAANKGKPVPDTGAQATSALDTYFKDTPQESNEDPTRSFMDAYANMDPVQASIFQQVSGLLSTQTNQQSLTDFYKQEVATQGIEALNTELMDMNAIIDGSEDDIREEITKAGGFATESQVQGMVAARNKTLLKKAQLLSDQINAKNDYVDRIVSLTQADREQVSKDLDRKLGIATTLFDMSQTMTNNAKENYKMIVDSVGWEGLAASLKGNKAQTARVEKLFGMAPGELQALAAYKKPATAMESLQLENQQLQNQKLKQDIGKGPEIQTQVVDIGGKKVLINSKTGQTIANLGGGGSEMQTPMQTAQSQQKIGEIDSLLNNSYLKTAVGPNPLARTSYFDLFTGGKSSFIGTVEQLREQLTLNALTQAKANGATFGALSDGERQTLAASATKLGTWAIKDSAGNVVGYKVGEDDFKKEMDRINNFAKLDFVLKGGEPTSVGVTEMADGTLWTKNSDGTFTKLN